MKHGRQPVYGLRLVFGLIVSFSSSCTVEPSPRKSGIPSGLDFVRNRITYLTLPFLTGLYEVPEAMLT